VPKISNYHLNKQGGQSINRCFPYRIFSFYFLASVLFFLLSLHPTTTLYANPAATDQIRQEKTSQTNNILLLHSYHKGFKWTEDITHGVESVFNSQVSNIRLYIEYMDTKRIYDDTYLKYLYDLFQYKFKYLKFNFDRFYPYTEEQVEKIIAQANEAERINQLIYSGGEWINKNLNNPENTKSPEAAELIKILRSYYLYENDSPHSKIAKAMLSHSQIDSPGKIFKLLVDLRVWDICENLDLYKYNIPLEFSAAVLKEADSLVKAPRDYINADGRRDLTELPLMTIDGSQTLDYDDALSIEKDGDNYRIGVHIIDVGSFIPKGSALDQEALNRASSIYMPDQRIPMLPNCLAEDLCSLKVNEVRPAITIFAKVNAFAELIDYEVITSVIKVERQLTYFDANMMIEADKELKALYQMARLFRQKRLNSGAIQINIPEVNIWFTEENEIAISKTERESPGRILVSEMMIMANWLMAMFLSKREMPAIFRSQSDPKSRLKMDEEGTLFQNWMQRKLLSRAVIGTKAEFHSGLGLNAYLTATSPIRKYFDLVVQRQISGVLGLGTSYSRKEVKDMIHMLETPMSQVMRVQFLRHRFWILKYLEGRKGKKEEAIVLDKRRNNYTILLTEYVVESKLPLSSSMNLKPGDVIQVTIQHVNARQETLSVYLG